MGGCDNKKEEVFIGEFLIFKAIMYCQMSPTMSRYVQKYYL